MSNPRRQKGKDAEAGPGKGRARPPAPEPEPEPPARPPYVRPRPAMSVYVDRDACVLLGGRRSNPLAQAVRCWAHVVVEPTNDNARHFTPAEWTLLARVWEGREASIEPEMAVPAGILADGVERVARVGGAGPLGVTEESLITLAGKVRALGYLHAWALIWALQWRAHKKVSFHSSEEWWTLAHRQENADPEKE